MPSGKTAWGIEIGQCALRAIKLRAAADNKVEVLDHIHIEHAKILSQPDADRPALIAEAMSKFAGAHDLSNDTLVVAVPGQHTLARFTKLPPVDKKKIPELVKYEAQQQIPFDMDEVIWDYQVFQTPETMETEVGIFAMRRDLLREYLLPLTSRTLEPAAVQSAPLALFNALRFDGVVPNEAVCILDIGAQNTDLIIVDGNSLWARNIPIGGNNFTEALLKTFKLSFRKAERLKRDAQKHKYARQIFQAMRPAFADLVAEVQRSIGFFTSSRRGVKLGKIIAMGNAFKLPGMVKFLQQNLGMDVIRPTTFTQLTAGEGPNAAEFAENMLSFGVSYGLALQGLGLAQITSNLLPPEIAKQVVWRKKMPWFYGAAACLALAAGMVWGRNILDQGVVTEAKASGSPLVFNPVYDPKDTDKQDPQPDPRAYDVIRKGSQRPTPVDKANDLIAAANHLNTVLSQIKTKNDKDLAEVTEITRLQDNKSVWPAVLYLVFSALPSDKALAAALAKGPDAYKSLIESNHEQYDRGKRAQVFIEQFNCEYSPDVIATFRDKKERSGGAAGTGKASADQALPGKALPLPGFLITLHVRTPNQGGFDFVDGTFLANLRKASHKNLVYVDNVLALGRKQLKDQTGGGTFRGGVRTARAPSPSGAMPVADTRNTDPVTGESMDNDWEFDVILAAVLGERPAEPPAASGTTGSPADGGTTPGAKRAAGRP